MGWGGGGGGEVELFLIFTHLCYVLGALVKAFLGEKRWFPGTKKHIRCTRLQGIAYLCFE